MLHLKMYTIDIFKVLMFYDECLIVLFDLILYVPSTIFQLNRDGSSWVKPVLSKDKCVLLKGHNAVKPVRLEPAAPSQAPYHCASLMMKSKIMGHTCDT